VVWPCGRVGGFGIRCWPWPKRFAPCTAPPLPAHTHWPGAASFLSALLAATSTKTVGGVPHGGAPSSLSYRATAPSTYAGRRDAAQLPAGAEAPQADGLREGGRLLLEADGQGLALHLHSLWRRLALERDVAARLVDAQATPQGRKRNGTPL